MKVKLIQIGKTSDSYIQEGVAIFQKRLKHYIGVEEITIATKKTRGTPDQVKAEEAKQILAKVENGDWLIPLDELGKQYNSENWAKWWQSRMNISSGGALVFVIGGAYGFDSSIYKRANEKLGFSKFTFTHQMVRLLFWEQCYRAHTILRGEAYHNR